MKRLSVGLVLVLIGSFVPLGITGVAGSTPTFVAVTDGAVSSLVTVKSIDPCKKPDPTYTEWVANISFAQGGNPELTYQDLSVAADGSWFGSIRVPISAVLGHAQLVATCFNASGGLLEVAYAPVDFIVTPGTFDATPTGALGSSITVRSEDGCVTPAGAGDWVAIVNFAQGSNAQLSFVDLAVAADGSWSGTIRVPPTATLGPAQLVASCFDAQHNVSFGATYTSDPFNVTPGSFDAAPGGAVGSSVTVKSIDPCFAPAGAFAWTVIVHFAQGGNNQLNFATGILATDGSWSGTFVVPATAVLGPAQVTARCFDASNAIVTVATYSPVSFTVSATVTAATRVSTAATATAPAVRVALG